MADNELDLIAKAKKGDKAAFSKLVEQYYDMVYGLAYGVLNFHEDAKDAAQEVFLKVFHQIKKFEGKSKFKTWLYRIAVNAAIDIGRKKRPTESLNQTVNDEEGSERIHFIPDGGRSPREEVREGELKELFQEALKELSPEHKAVLVLREWQELSYEEIADTLGIDVGTVMSRLFYGRKKLAEVLRIQLED